MKKTSIIFSLFAMVIFITGCEEFLEKEPLSQGTEAIFFKTPEHFAAAANALYNLEGWKSYDNSNISGTRLDQGLDISGFSSNGGGAAGQDDWRWDRPYSYIRNCNNLLQKAEEYKGDKASLNASVGTAYFFRAWQHFYLLQRFGGVPILDHSPTVSPLDPVLFSARKSRYEVAYFIISDLRKAIPMLPMEKNISATDKGKISQEAAKSFLARVLLYEATWEKYVPAIGYDLDGNGTALGAGTTKPTGYPTITEMFTEAKKWSGEVITEAETGTFKLWNECDSLSYYYLFSIDEKGGNISNFKGAGKATNKEFILSVKYDYDIRRSGVNIGHSVSTWQFTNISAYFGEMFLCRNGLPIYISNDGVTREKNPQFLGFSRFYDEFRNRDYRFIGCAYLPDRVSWMSNTNYGVNNTQLGKPYPDPVYPKVPYDAKDPAFSNKLTIYVPTLYGGTHNNYGSRKYMPEGAGRSSTTTESQDYPLIRLAEVHLIYAEAAVELGNGVISDADLNFSINKNRARARVAPLTNALIANLWDAGYWDHAQNRTIIKKMNMLDEIRRERACELFGEGFRENDLKRWGIAHINLRGQKLGRYVYGTEYMTAIANDATYHGQPAYQPNKYPLTYGVFEGSGTGDLDYGRSIATLPGNLLYSQRDYLAPIPLTQIRLNPELKQNPGW